jgi:uncharacterized protein YqeY
MTLEQRLGEDMKEAMRAKEELRLSVIRMLRSAILLEKKKPGAPDAVPDEVVTALVRSHVKRLKEAVETAEKAGRADLAEQAQREIAIAQAYLPAEMSDDEITALVAEAVSSLGAVDLKSSGPVMKAVMEKAKGRVDGRRVQEAVKRALGGDAA